MTEKFVPVPEKILKKLHEKGDKNVLYSSFGAMKTPFGKTASMKDRTNEELVKKTFEGEKLGSAYETFEVPLTSGECYDYYYNIVLQMIKLPSVLIDDDLLKFISVADEKSEILHFNSSKLHFDEDGDFLKLSYFQKLLLIL